MNFLKHTSCFKNSNLLARSSEIYGQLAYTMLALESRASLPNHKRNIILCIAKELHKIFLVLNGKATAYP